MAYQFPSTACAAIKSAVATGDTVTESASTRASALAAKETAHQSTLTAKDAQITSLTEQLATANAAKADAEENGAIAHTAYVALLAAVTAYLAKVDAEEDATDERAALDTLLPSAESADSGDDT